MKKKIYLLSLVAMSFAFTGALTSCSEDDLQIESPNDIKQENFYKTEEDFEMAIRGVYNDFRTNGLFGNTGQARDIVILGDLMSDNLIFSPYGRGGGFTASEWRYQGNSNVTELYENAYKAVSDANKILSVINNLPESSTVKPKVKAEALALRALAHFEVAKLFAKIPTQASGAANSQGIAYISELNFKDEPKREANIGIVYDKIIKDLEDALAGGLPNGGYAANPTGNTIYRLNKLSVRGLLAKVYLYKGDYPKVIEYATPVVDAIKPTDKADLDKFWKTETNQGALFVLPFARTNDIQLGTNYSQGLSANTLRVEFTVDKAFVGTFDQATEPERYNASIVKMVQNQYDGAGPVYAVKKYMYSRTGYNAGVNDGRYLRVEDVILMLAEAQYMSGNQSGALTTLNKLRDARYTAYTGGETGDALFEAIITERRKELAFEVGDRFFTLKRLLGVPGIPVKYAQGIQRSGNGHYADGTGSPSATQQLPASSVKWQLPVRQSILNLDKNIGQTDGY
ncbi:RagB/SusD family nutrient uptake outer membrane protein [Empedobacter brevis]|uniref:RagB/SusD family nutrient uptake outer membrane protein n=1 Tax=Empedobacter brevis TaxID=247 RepID=UPI0023F1E853|nr:RagB/SusD family nutrient uptake outer membrane protein [Empedobacter brevis]